MVMVSFCKFKLSECKRQFICKYIISNIKTIAYKLKSIEERMQTQEFIVVRRNPTYIHSPLASILSLRFH